jgi:hypothetical protein
MDHLECKSTSIGSVSPEGLGIMVPKSSMTSMPSKVTLDWLSSSCSMCHCLLAPLVDMPVVDIPSSTSGAEATTIVPIKGSMPLLQLQHLTTSLCWWACSTITGWQWLWYIRCCSIRANHLSQPWHLSLFFHDDNNSCLEAGQAGSDIKCWQELLICVGGRSVRLWCRANDGLAGSAFKLK